MGVGHIRQERIPTGARLQHLHDGHVVPESEVRRVQDRPPAPVQRSGRTHAHAVEALGRNLQRAHRVHELRGDFIQHGADLPAQRRPGALPEHLARQIDDAQIVALAPQIYPGDVHRVLDDGQLGLLPAQLVSAHGLGLGDQALLHQLIHDLRDRGPRQLRAIRQLRARNGPAANPLQYHFAIRLFHHAGIDCAHARPPSLEVPILLIFSISFMKNPANPIKNTSNWNKLSNH